MKVLLVLDHAPDYREGFLKQLSEKCTLTVMAQSCEADKLTAPAARAEYEYIESQSYRLGPFRWCFGLPKLLRSKNFDVICVAFNPHHPWRLIPFLFCGPLRHKWVWWGQVYGRSKSKTLSLIRQYLFSRSPAVLVYSQDIADALAEELPRMTIRSFNNSQARQMDYERVPFHVRADGVLRLLFVGRPQNRKRLHLLLKVAARRPDVHVRLVGPGMVEFVEKICASIPQNVHCFAGANGNLLRSHFEWCDLVANPGHLGLLVVNAAQHGRAIVVQKNVVHAPEVILAREANQLFIDFESSQDVDWLIEQCRLNVSFLTDMADELFHTGLERYSVENMVQCHLSVFQTVASPGDAQTAQRVAEGT